MARLPLHRWRYSTRLLFSGCDQATYQQDLVIHRTAGQDHEEVSGGLRIWHIYLGPRCRPDYGDLRFTDHRGRELAYYLWPGFDATSARFTVRLEGADAAGALSVHYGNPAAATTSDPDAVGYCDAFSEISEAWDASGVATATIDDGRLKTTGIADTWESYKTASVKRPVSIPYAFSAEVDLDYVETPNCLGKLFLVVETSSSFTAAGYQDDNSDAAGGFSYILNGGSEVFSGKNTRPASGKMHLQITRDASNTIKIYENGNIRATGTMGGDITAIGLTNIRFQSYSGNIAYWDNLVVRAYSAAPPSFLRSTRGVNPAYAGLARLTGSAAADDWVIQFAGVGDIRVLGDERDGASGVGSFAIETSVRSRIQALGAAILQADLNLATPAAIAGVGGVISEPARLHTPLDIEAGEGSAYVAPTPVQFDLTKYRFSSLTISRSAQDALWRCEGRIVGLDAPLAYKQFEVRVPDHNGVLRTLFVGFVPGRDYVRAVAADESIIQGYDAGFYLTRQYLPDGDLTYPRVFGWGPARLLHYFLGEESVSVYSRSRWEQITGIMPYRLENPPSYYEWPYSSRIDWVFQPKTTKAQAIQEICEKSGLVFLVKWRKIHGAWTPCAYLVPEEDIDHPTRGLDLPDPVTFTHPDPHVIDGVRVTMRSDEKYNRIVVRSAAPSGAWFEAIRETPGLRYGDELPIEYLEERGDLPDEADHGDWCSMRADELYDYYTKYAYTYTLTLINRVDLELYQRCRFYGFDAIPSGEMMRIVAITYNVLPTHSEVEITVTPDSRLSDLRRLQRSQTADSVSEVQTIAQSQIDRVAMGEVGTVVGVEGNEAIVELERKTDSSVRGRIV